MYRPDPIWEFSMVDSIKFGLGASEELSDGIKRRNASSVLFISDRGVEEAGILEYLSGTLDEDIEHEIYAEVKPEPPLSVFEEALGFASDFEPDVIVGIGGGSSMDVAKTTGVLLEHGGEISEYISPPTGEGKPIPSSGVPTFCIPTTTGTGSETSPVAVVSLPEKKLKAGISSKFLYPNLALVDPLLTVSLPPDMTASSGMDALTHAIEAFITRRYDWRKKPESALKRPNYCGRSILTSTIAKKAVELISNNLREAYNNGKNVEARRNMSLASLMAGIAFTNAGLGATHAIAYAVAGEHHTPHGITNAILLPEVIHFNASGAINRSIKIAENMGEDLTGCSRIESARKAADGVRKLASNVGIPKSLTDLGVSEDEIEQLAKETMNIQRLLEGNPREIKKEDVEEILRRSL